MAYAGTDIYHASDSGTFTLRTDGNYEVSYHTVVTNAANATPPVSPGVHLTRGGETVAGTTAVSTIPAAGHMAALAGTAVISVTAAPVEISLAANNGEGTFTHSSVTIRKLD